MAIGKNRTPKAANVVEVSTAEAPAAKVTKPAAEPKVAKTDARARKISYVDIDTIVSEAEAPRRKVNAEAFDAGVNDLRNSILTIGLQSPLVVTADDTGKVFTLRAGYGRLAAIKAIRANTPKVFKSIFPEGVPVTIAHVDESLALVESLTENFMRSDRDIREIYMRLIAARDAGVEFDPKAIGKCTGLKASQVSSLIAIADQAIASVREAFLAKAISFEKAAALAEKSPEEQEKAMAPETIDDESTVTAPPTVEDVSKPAKPGKPGKKEINAARESIIAKVCRAHDAGKTTEAALAAAAYVALDYVSGLLKIDGMLSRISDETKMNACVAKIVEVHGNTDKDAKKAAAKKVTAKK